MYGLCYLPLFLFVYFLSTGRATPEIEGSTPSSPAKTKMVMYARKRNKITALTSAKADVTTC